MVLNLYIQYNILIYELGHKKNKSRCFAKENNILLKNMILVMKSFNLICFLINRKECGLEKFVPSSLAETMKRKELRKLLGHFLKLNSSLTAGGGNGSSQKSLTALQAKLHYLKIISDLPSYGAKCFSTNMSVSIILYTF